MKYCLTEINKIVKRYKLELNHKTRIYHINEGFEFLGFKYIRKNKKLVIKVKNQTKKRFNRKMKIIYKLYLNNNIDIKKARVIESSYLGHLKYGNTKKLISTTLKRYKKDKYYDLGKKIIIDNNGNIIIYKK